MKELRRSSIFFIALITRLLLSIVFLGSSDFFLGLDIAREVFEHGFPYTSRLPYFPLMPIFFLGQMLLAAVTNIPLAFWMKFVAVIFDALMAVLVTDIARARCGAGATYKGLLYALSPIALLVTSVHGQWDALPHFFLLYSFYLRDYWDAGYKSNFLFGFLFALSFMLKPYTIIFVLFFLKPYKESLRKELGSFLSVLQGAAAGALAMTIGCYIFFKLSNVSLMSFVLGNYYLWGAAVFYGVVFALLALWHLGSIKFSPYFMRYLTEHIVAGMGLWCAVVLFFSLFYTLGFDLLKTTDCVLRHFNQGVQHFGMLFAYPIRDSFFYPFLKNRFWLMGLIARCSWLYYKQNIDVYMGMLLSFCAVLLFSGYLSTYFVWLLPLFLIVGGMRAVALINLFGGSLLLLVYSYPYSNPEIPFHNSLTLAHLKIFPWLQMPDFFKNECFSDIIMLLGNYGMPVLCAGIVLFYVRDIILGKLVPVQQKIRAHEKPLRLLCVAVGVMLFLGVICLFFQGAYSQISPRVNHAFTSLVAGYNVVLVEGGRMSAAYGGNSWVNAATLFFLLIIGWSLAVLCKIGIKKVPKK